MNSAALADTLFPLPPAAPGLLDELKTPIDRYRHFMELSEAHGGLIPQNIIPDLVGLSPQRVHQLVKAGRFEVLSVFGQTFVTAGSFGEFVQTERKQGRPCKGPGNLQIAKASLRAGKEISRMFTKNS